MRQQRLAELESKLNVINATMNVYTTYGLTETLAELERTRKSVQMLMQRYGKTTPAPAQQG